MFCETRENVSGALWDTFGPGNFSVLLRNQVFVLPFSTDAKTSSQWSKYARLSLRDWGNRKEKTSGARVPFASPLARVYKFNNILNGKNALQK